MASSSRLSEGVSSSSSETTFNILLGVTGSVATIKAEQIIRELLDVGLERPGKTRAAAIAVKVIATERAKHFLLVVEPNKVRLCEDLEQGQEAANVGHDDDEEEQSFLQADEDEEGGETTEEDAESAFSWLKNFPEVELLDDASGKLNWNGFKTQISSISTIK